MVIEMANLVTGGEGWKAYKRQVRAAQANRKEVAVGWFETDRYDDHDSTPVAAVAAANEWGAGRTPERPFIRPAVRELRKTLGPAIASSIDPRKMTLDDTSARQAGEMIRDTVVQSIERVYHPPNAPATLERKAGDRLLTDSGTMKETIRIRVGENIGL